MSVMIPKIGKSAEINIPAFIPIWSGVMLSEEAREILLPIKYVETQKADENSKLSNIDFSATVSTANGSKWGADDAGAVYYAVAAFNRYGSHHHYIKGYMGK